MPKLIRLYIVNVAIGFALSAIFLAAMIVMDVAGLGRLILGSDMGLLAALMIFVFQGVVFAGVQFAIAVMRMAEEDTSPPRGGLRQHLTPAPVRVAQGSAHQRRAKR
ncbi:MAG: hypothetical protein MUF74_07720 [Cypionkella sp.]|jgi:hypothetical protein|nr:hypothetical protein [Cypionkella sp.]